MVVDLHVWKVLAMNVIKYIHMYFMNDQQHCYHHAPKIKPEAATAVVELLMMGVRMPETC